VQLNQPNIEALKFRIGLSGTYWDKKPKFSILIGDTLYVQGAIELPAKETQYVEFSAELADDSAYCLKIRLENKTESDTLQSEDKSEILQDMLLNIESIEIDDIDVGIIKWTASKFVGDDPARPVLEACVNLGWNGSYMIEFKTPYYLWLLENM